jgi:hypothetical protein
MPSGKPQHLPSCDHLSTFSCARTSKAGSEMKYLHQQGLENRYTDNNEEGASQSQESDESTYRFGVHNKLRVPGILQQ